MDAFAKDRYSRESFALALKSLMEEQQLSYRRLAAATELSAGYLSRLGMATRPVPTDSVIAVIAEALGVVPEFFLEYRVRQIVTALSGNLTLADSLYGILLCKQPVPKDISVQLTAGSDTREDSRAAKPANQ